MQLETLLSGKYWHDFLQSELQQSKASSYFDAACRYLKCAGRESKLVVEASGVHVDLAQLYQAVIAKGGHEVSLLFCALCHSMSIVMDAHRHVALTRACPSLIVHAIHTSP